MHTRTAVLIVKRTLDLVGAAVGLGVGAPLLAITAVLVRQRLGSPVLFRQVRPGRGGRLFTIYKFRTMNDDRDADGQLLTDEQRLTPFGAWLRATSLDELPELYNVLVGDMSLVGPRPLLPAYLSLYSPAQARRHELRPGLTGLAQVSGRNALDWEARLELDVWYVDHVSLSLDARLLLRTVGQVARRSGVSQDGFATVAAFQGTDARCA